MKKVNLFCFFACLLLLASCKKTGEFLPSGGDEEDNTTTLKHGQSKEKQFMITRIDWSRNNLGTAGERLFVFYLQFNNKGQLDFVQRGPQIFGGIGVHRSRGKIDSIISTFPFDAPTIVKSGFEYDRHGDIARFTVSNFLSSDTLHLKLSYDQGHAHRIDVRRSNPSLSDVNVFDYVGNDLVRWTNLNSSSRSDIRYTYDRKHLNPIYFIDDLVPIFSFDTGWEFFLETEHVTTSIYYVQSQQLVPIQNFYDRKGRLVKKVWTEPSMPRADSLVFSYVN